MTSHSPHTRMRFEHNTLAQRVRFASGGAATALDEEVAALGASLVMVIASSDEWELARRIAAGLPVVHRHNGVAMHVPVPVAARARAAASAHEADALVCVGGGSTTGWPRRSHSRRGCRSRRCRSGRCPRRTPAPRPPTSGGSHRTTVRPPASKTVCFLARDRLRPLAHAHASVGPQRRPIDRALAAGGIRALGIGLPQVLTHPTELQGREHTLCGAYLAAVALGSAGSRLHHKTCQALGGVFDLPHAQTHAVVLPHVLAFNAQAAPEAEQRIAEAFGSDAAPGGLARLRAEVDAPAALRDHGLPEAGDPGCRRGRAGRRPFRKPANRDRRRPHRLVAAAWEGAEPR